jgi:hypothetical protein
VYVGITVLSLWVLAHTYSRSAMAGLFVGSVIVVAMRSIHTYPKYKMRRAAFGMITIVLVLSSGLYLFRNNTVVQKVVFHTDIEEAGTINSDQQRINSLIDGLKDVGQNPFGSGVGSVGPASLYQSNKQEKITENYYIQTTQELGWLGGALFIGILILLVHDLLQKSHENPFAYILLCGLISMIVINIFLPAWTDEVLGTVWWVLAGFVVSGWNDKRLKYAP